MQGVLGGGVSGLAAAYYLSRNTVCSVKLIEASQRVGGWIKSTLTPTGHIFEHGPRTIRPKGEPGENTLALISELDLSHKVLPIRNNHPAAKRRLIYVNKKLFELPSSLLSLIRVTPPFTKPIISALFHDMRTPKKVSNDESIYDFVGRRLGKEIADYAISPLICGVCAGDAKEISVKLLMNSLFEAEQNHGSITSGMIQGMLHRKGSKNISKSENILVQRSKKEKWNVYSLEGGLEVLTQTLEQSIKKKGVDIMLNSPCEDITFTKSDTVLVKANGLNYEFNNIISSLPASTLAPLLQNQFPELSKKLAEISTVTVGVVHLQYDGQVLNKDAFGFLVPASENIPILGVVFDSCCFPKGDSTVLTVMMGGRWFEEQFGINPTPETLYNTAVKHVHSILQVSDKPNNYSVSILKKCIPQYVVGHHERVQWIKSFIDSHNLPLSLVGASYDGVSINDVILSAKKAVHCMKL